MKKRWKIAIGLAAAAVAFVAIPAVYIQAGCRGGVDPDNYRSLAGMRRAEARTWLTYPEWHIVYAADALGAWLTAGKPPSGYPYLRDANAFWTSYCAINRVAGGRAGSGSASIMLHTIGVSFTAEMLVKSVYENTFGRLSEWIGGWHSPDDRFAGRVQQRYGAFMHTIPWYAFPFGSALSGVWSLPGGGFRHWERRGALSAEYGVKAVYAKAIGGASNATLGPDETRMHMVLEATPAQVRQLDPRLVPIKQLNDRLVLVRTPRYAAFTDIVLRLAERDVPIVEIAGNDDIFLTVLMPANAKPDSAGAETVMAMALADGRVRRGFTVKVPELIPLIRTMRAQGDVVEHVYDY